MTNKKPRRKFKLRFFLIIGVMLYAVVTIITQQSTITKQELRRAELEAELAEAEFQLSVLKSKLDYIGTDSYIEQAARDKLGWVKEGELIFKIAGVTEAQPSSEPTAGGEPAGTGAPAAGDEPSGSSAPVNGDEPTPSPTPTAPPQG